MVFCSQCGANCGAGVSFCSSCGAQVGGGAVKQATTFNAGGGSNLAGKYDGQAFYSNNYGAGTNQVRNVELFTTSATASLLVKKEQQSLKFLLDGKKVSYVEYDVASNEAKRNEMRSRSGQTKLPQLFINGTYIGSWEEIQELEEIGELNGKLGINPK